MEYSIRELSQLAGVSARTLRYYDEIDLLKPLYANEAGVRYYGEAQVNLLQQILFYRERGLALKQIQQIISQADFDLIGALEEHLLALREQRNQVDALIETVQQTIASVKGEREMSDSEKFEALKKAAIQENEERYGVEVIQKYGKGALEASNQKLMGMSREAWEEFQHMETELRERLQMAVSSGLEPDSHKAREITALHKAWLCKSLKEYTPQIHKGLAEMYVADERFRSYYDRKTEGCAEWLKAAIDCWADQLEK